MPDTDADGSAPSPESGLAARWTARLTELATRVRVPGATLGIWAGGQETLAAHGVLSTATGVSVTTGSLFQVGSITKVWTATMIMQLAAEGRLSLDTAVAKLLPGARLGDPDGSAEITVAHLLTHTSGLEGDIFRDTGRGDGCVRRYVDDLAAAGRVYPPGAAYSYCNSGFTVLGRIIEVLDGRTWDESLRERLIGPLGLTQTVTLPEEAIVHRTAVGHRGHPHSGEPSTVWALPRSAGPAGTITASAHDVLTFARMHLNGGLSQDGTRLLGEDAVAAMQETRGRLPLDRGAQSAIGLAWHLGRWEGQPVIGHDGGTIGQTSYLRVAPEPGVAVCLLTNGSSTATLYRELFAEVFTEFAGISPPPAVAPAAEPVDLDLDLLTRHTGRYERVSHRYDVSVQDGKLHVLSTQTVTLDDLADNEPEDLILHPLDVTGDRFVLRSYPEEPWTELMFGRLDDGRPYLHIGGRLSPKIG
jgi:CubicO group peptidase (beta-lactamase class C family)